MTSASEGTNMFTHEALMDHEATDLNSWYDGFHYLELGPRDIDEFQIILDEDRTETEWAASLIRRSNLDRFLTEFQKWEDLSKSFTELLTKSRSILKTESIRNVRKILRSLEDPRNPLIECFEKILWFTGQQLPIITWPVREVDARNTAKIRAWSIVYARYLENVEATVSLERFKLIPTLDSSSGCSGRSCHF
jgi:hypothetical protein